LTLSVVVLVAGFNNVKCMNKQGGNSRACLLGTQCMGYGYEYYQNFWKNPNL
jgi:hypothetical protein